MQPYKNRPDNKTNVGSSTVRREARLHAEPISESCSRCM